MFLIVTVYKQANQCFKSIIRKGIYIYVSLIANCRTVWRVIYRSSPPKCPTTLSSVVLPFKLKAIQCFKSDVTLLVFNLPMWIRHCSVCFLMVCAERINCYFHKNRLQMYHYFKTFHSKLYQGLLGSPSEMIIFTFVLLMPLSRSSNSGF